MIVTGEVRFRAGGLLPIAYIEGGRYYRELDAVGRIDVHLAEAVTAKPESEPVDVTPLFGTIVQIFASLVAIIAIATR